MFIITLQRIAVPLSNVARSLQPNCVKCRISHCNVFARNTYSPLGFVSSANFHNSLLSCQQPAANTESSISQIVEEPDKLYKLVEIETRGNDKAVLKSYSQFSQTAADHLGIEIGKCWAPTKPHHERFTVLKSIHVNKKNMVQYEFRTYFRFMQFHKLTGSTADTFLEYLQRNLPEGVAMKVTKVGLEKIPSHIKPQHLLKEKSES